MSNYTLNISTDVKLVKNITTSNCSIVRVYNGGKSVKAPYLLMHELRDFILESARLINQECEEQKNAKPDEAVTIEDPESIMYDVGGRIIDGFKKKFIDLPTGNKITFGQIWIKPSYKPEDSKRAERIVETCEELSTIMHSYYCTLNPTLRQYKHTGAYDVIDGKFVDTKTNQIITDPNAKLDQTKATETVLSIVMGLNYGFGSLAKIKAQQSAIKISLNGKHFKSLTLIVRKGKLEVEYVEGTEEAKAILKEVLGFISVSNKYADRIKPALAA